MVHPPCRCHQGPLRRSTRMLRTVRAARTRLAHRRRGPLDPTRVRRPGIQVLTLDALGDGSNETWWGTGRVFVKPSAPDHPYLATNEFIAARLATAVGLPVPMGDVGAYGDDRAAWVSAQIS